MKGLSLFFLMLACAPVAMAVRVGEKAPDFALNDLSGKAHKLSDYAGKLVVLEWVDHGCPFVEKHYDSGNMQGLQGKYTDKSVIWLGIRTGDADAKALIARNRSLKVAATAVLLDPDGKTAKAYGARTTPHMYIIGRDGKLAYSGALDDRPTPDPATVKGARNYVAEALEAMLAGKLVQVRATRPYGCAVKYGR